MPVFSLLLGDLVDALAAPGGMSKVPSIALAYLCIGAVAGAAAMAEGTGFGWLGERWKGVGWVGRRRRPFGRARAAARAPPPLLSPPAARTAASLRAAFFRAALLADPAFHAAGPSAVDLARTLASDADGAAAALRDAAPAIVTCGAKFATGVGIGEQGKGEEGRGGGGQARRARRDPHLATPPPPLQPCGAAGRSPSSSWPSPRRWP